MAHFSQNQRKAIRALLSQPTIAQAAREANLGRSTLYRYLKAPDFQAELRKQQDAALMQLTSRLVGGSGEALEVLQAVFADKEATHSVKVRAAAVWLSAVLKNIELQDWTARLRRLEDKIMRGDK